jgi:hypothetical protein
MRDCGGGHWERFLPRREHGNLERYAGTFIALVLGDRQEYPLTKRVIAKAKRFSRVPSVVVDVANETDAEPFLKLFEGHRQLASLDPPSHADIPEAWAQDEGRQWMLFDIYRLGLSHLLSGVVTENLQEYGAALLRQLPPLADQPMKILPDEHDAIVKALMRFGYPSPEEFGARVRVSGSTMIVCGYAETIIRFCHASRAERVPIKAQLVEKIPDYQLAKIAQRLTLFEKVRMAARDVATYAAEDIEFLTAVTFHGTIAAKTSPVLNVLFTGQPKDEQIDTRLKTLFSLREFERKTQELPEELPTPLRVHNSLMIAELGKIDARPGFHNNLYVYPLGYQCYCGSISAQDPTELIWWNGLVSQNF